MTQKQYTYEPAYTGNLKIKKYIDGILKEEFIINDYALSGVQICLESEGYSLAHDIDAAEEAVRIAKEEYERALEYLEYCKKNPLLKK